METIKYHDRYYYQEFLEYHTPFWISFWLNDDFANSFERLTGTDAGSISMLVNDQNNGYMEERSSEILLKSMRPRLTKEWLDDERANFNRIFSQIQSLVEGIKADKDVLIFDKIPRIRELFKLMPQAYVYSNSFYMMSHCLEGEIVDILSKEMPKSEATVVFNQSSTPVEPTLLTRYHKELIAIAGRLENDYIIGTIDDLKQLYKTNSDVREVVNALAKKFYFLTSINSVPRSGESFIPDIFEGNARPKTVDVEVSVPDSAKDKIYVMKNVGYFKDECSTYFIPYIRFALDREWNELAKLVGLTYGEMQEFMPEEVLTAAEASQNLSGQVNDKQIGTLIIHEAHKPCSVKWGIEAVDLFNSLVVKTTDQNLDNISEVTGKIGSTGYAKGEVAIVQQANQIRDFKEGQVLVAVYTAPEFVPAMKKAAAIVTDTGGITCHAAIVARELGKPCIISTKIATKVFQDGDMVEVDANKGIVRKI